MAFTFVQMKNILVATDFSPQAYFAALSAAQLARHTGARVVLLHVFNLAAYLQSNPYWDEADTPEHQAQAKLDQLAHELHGKYGVSITRLLKPGFAADEIMALAQSVKADLIALGVSSQQTSSAGITTAAILDKCCFPVLSIPTGLTSDLLTGTAFFQEDGSQAAVVAELLQRYIPGITLVHRKAAVPAALVNYTGSSVQQKAL